MIYELLRILGMDTPRWHLDWNLSIMFYVLLAVLKKREEMFEINVVFKLCGRRILFSRVLKILCVVEI